MDRKGEITQRVYTNGILYPQPEDPQPPLLIHFCGCANNQRQGNSLLYMYSNGATLSTNMLCDIFWRSTSFLFILAISEQPDEQSKNLVTLQVKIGLPVPLLCTANHCRDAWNLRVPLEKGFAHVPQKMTNIVLPDLASTGPFVCLFCSCAWPSCSGITSPRYRWSDQNLFNGLTHVHV